MEQFIQSVEKGEDTKKSFLSLSQHDQNIVLKVAQKSSKHKHILPLKDTVHSLHSLFEPHEENYDLLIGKFTFLPNEKETLFNLPLQIRPEISIMGRTVRQNRDVQFFSDEVDHYFYSGREAKSQPLTNELRSVMNRVNSIFSDHYNGILVNRYNDGTQTIGKHRDAERDLGKNGVVSISLGATRTFRIRDASGGIVLDYPVEDEDIMIMAGDFQSYFTHEVIADKKVKEPRVSLTFRCHKR